MKTLVVYMHDVRRVPFTWRARSSAIVKDMTRFRAQSMMNQRGRRIILSRERNSSARTTKKKRAQTFEKADTTTTCRYSDARVRTFRGPSQSRQQGVEVRADVIHVVDGFVDLLVRCRLLWSVCLGRGIRLGFEAVVGEHRRCGSFDASTLRHGETQGRHTRREGWEAQRLMRQQRVRVARRLGSTTAVGAPR